MLTKLKILENVDKLENIGKYWQKSKLENIGKYWQMSKLENIGKILTNERTWKYSLSSLL